MKIILPKIAVDFVRSYEKYAKRLPDGSCEAYQDHGGVWTIGWGSTGRGIKQGVIWTPEQAEARFMRDMLRIAAEARNLAPGANDNQISAVISLIYNVGLPSLAASTTGRLMKEGNILAALERFPKWDKARVNGILTPSRGLLRRRNDEVKLAKGQWQPAAA